MDSYKNLLDDILDCIDIKSGKVKDIDKFNKLIERKNRYYSLQDSHAEGVMTILPLEYYELKNKSKLLDKIQDMIIDVKLECLKLNNIIIQTKDGDQ